MYEGGYFSKEPSNSPQLSFKNLSLKVCTYVCLNCGPFIANWCTNIYSVFTYVEAVLDVIYMYVVYMIISVKRSDKLELWEGYM